MKVLVAGGSGILGRHVVRQLLAVSHEVRALSRTGACATGAEAWRGDLIDSGSLRGACDGIEVVVSCAGASMKLGGWADRRSFLAVDYVGNTNLLCEAERAGVRKFVYVSLYAAERFLHTEYAKAHELFAEDLGRSRVASTVVRPTGFFAFFRELQEMAKKGRGVVVGAGTARTNPVHEEDAARACMDALHAPDAEICAGGPDVFSREEIVRLAFASVGRKASPLHVPPAVFRTMTAPLRLVNPRMHSLIRFGVEVSLTDVVAPAYGSRRLQDYFSGCESRRG